VIEVSDERGFEGNSDDNDNLNGNRSEYTEMSLFS